MKLLNLLSFGCLVTALALAPACKQTADVPAPPVPTAPIVPVAPAQPAAGSAVVPEAAVDHITVLAHHLKPKPIDPVHLNFDKFRVVKAAFDPQHIEGGTATIELDLSSFHTDSAKRDEHVKSPAYLDIGKLATATIAIANVKLASGSTYTADATVDAHGLAKTFPVTFEVLSTTATSIRIKAEQAFSRLDFGVGTDPAADPEQQVATDLTIEMVLTLAKT